MPLEQVHPVPKIEGGEVVSGPGLIYREIKRGEGGRFYFEEHITFGEDSGYDNNSVMRAFASLGRACDELLTRGPDGKPDRTSKTLDVAKMPPFDPQNRLRVVFEVIPAGDVEARLVEAEESASPATNFWVLKLPELKTMAQEKGVDPELPRKELIAALQAA